MLAYKNINCILRLLWFFHTCTYWGDIAMPVVKKAPCLSSSGQENLGKLCVWSSVDIHKLLPLSLTSLRKLKPTYILKGGQSPLLTSSLALQVKMNAEVLVSEWLTMLKQVSLQNTTGLSVDFQLWDIGENSTDFSFLFKIFTLLLPFSLPPPLSWSCSQWTFPVLPLRDQTMPKPSGDSYISTDY